MTPSDDKPATELGKDTGELPPELQGAFDQIVTRLSKRRKVHIWGYVIAVLLCLFGLPLGLYYMGLGPGEPRGWILLVPVALAALTLYVAGRWAKKL
jgi:hypothetical protein